MAVSPVSHHAANIPARQSPSHTVQYGDTLSAIALRHGLGIDQLLAANPQILNPDVIYPNEQVSLPIGGDEASGVPAASGGTVATGAGGIERVGGSLDTEGGITADQLLQIVPTLDPSRAPAIAEHLDIAMAEAKVDTPQRQAMFIAQLAHESGGFQYLEEIASGANYEGRADLGNTEPGDGERYKGRGYIQITGRYNYAAAGEALGLDLINNPELASLPENAARIAAWYWSDRNINAAADAGNFVEVTRLINGGTNGLADREAYYARAQDALY
ncbi:glycoside hydrolase family 19 protein [Luteimonas terricola]|nr:glycoside hydrolase family 19 protein [Luteimonas terricola]